jgi:hypothetical protein
VRVSTEWSIFGHTWHNHNGRSSVANNL